MTELLKPTDNFAQTATLSAFKGHMADDDIHSYLKSLSATGVPDPLGATASLTFAVFWGVCKCEPRDKPWVFDEDVWGIGAAAIASAGFMYTACSSWNDFFTRTTGFHVQGITEGGGVYQINWFDGGTPIGQFNGASGGIAAFEAGANGKWKKK